MATALSGLKPQIYQILEQAFYILRTKKCFLKKEVLSIPFLLNRFVNILTDFADAEIFLIDGDSLLLEIIGEKSLDWNNGEQFLHLTYLTERFLQKFTEKG